jgi:hypothetical protein
LARTNRRRIRLNEQTSLDHAFVEHYHHNRNPIPNNKNNRKQLIKKAHQLGNFVNSTVALLRQGFNKLLIWQKLNFVKNSSLYKRSLGFF